MAAQALVRRSYAAPIETFAANVLGVGHAARRRARLPRDARSVVIVTSDKAYENVEWPWGYRETDALGGHDPYSASKACAEIAAASMRRAFFHRGGHPARIATVRAGNVIGGGDWAERPADARHRARLSRRDGVVRLRNPDAVRPWQHVLEPLSAYLLLAERLYEGPAGRRRGLEYRSRLRRRTGPCATSPKR